MATLSTPGSVVTFDDRVRRKAALEQTLPGAHRANPQREASGPPLPPPPALPSTHGVPGPHAAVRVEGAPRDLSPDELPVKSVAPSRAEARERARAESEYDVHQTHKSYQSVWGILLILATVASMSWAASLTLNSPAAALKELKDEIHANEIARQNDQRNTQETIADLRTDLALLKRAESEVEPLVAKKKGKQ